MAADEHRKKFALTNIKSAGTQGCELYLPGVHSDIGGSYRNEASEDMVVYQTHRVEEAAAERDRLIAAGWYRADEITIKTGAAQIVMKSNGDITMSGKTINIKGSGNVVLNGSKVITN